MTDVGPEIEIVEVEPIRETIPVIVLPLPERAIPEAVPEPAPA